MIKRESLLSDLRGLLKTLEDDLLARSASNEVPEVRAALEAEYKTAMEAERTALNYEDWQSDYITQMATAWVLTCVFARFLEDNGLIESPQIAGPGDRLQWARDQHQVYFTKHPTETDREYLLYVFAKLRDLGDGTAGDVFGEHNVLWQLPNWLSGDAAGLLLEFFRKINPGTGEVVHDFTDPEWDTRFLGDLYQDLSEKARKKYALLQTPDFVEEFILDRTLEPALDEFGLRPGQATALAAGSAASGGTPETSVNSLFKMIDPACGSGHFLLGAFRRILKRWREHAPSTDIRELVRRTLRSIHGVDINPFAIAIARFRLLLAALKACDCERLIDAPAFDLSNLACGDSLYHGRQRQQTLGDWTDESHYFRTEDAENLRRILQEGTFHAVVANPPYITPKDKAARSTYKRLYASCHMKYSLSVPFMERIFKLATDGKVTTSGGFTGQITANSFMKREFGKKLIEQFASSVDLTHVVDSSLAYVPGHGTPTAILFGRNRSPVGATIRTAMGIRREAGTPDDPSQGLVWRAILEQLDTPGSQNEYISVTDSERARFETHPWSIGGGGAAELQELLSEKSESVLDDVTSSVGVLGMTNAEDVMVSPREAFLRCNGERQFTRWIVAGENVRNWTESQDEAVFFPYREAELVRIDELPQLARFLWPTRTILGSRRTFGGGTYFTEGRPWWEWHQLTTSRLRPSYTIALANISTHIHAVLCPNDRCFNVTVIVIQPTKDNRDDCIRLVALLNSSVACFWLRQVCQAKGGSGINQGIYEEEWEKYFAFNGTNIKQLPIPNQLPDESGRLLCESMDKMEAYGCAGTLNAMTDHQKPLRTLLSNNEAGHKTTSKRVAFLQEDLDWECYRLHGLLEEDLTYQSCQSCVVRGQEERTDDGELKTEDSFGIQLGERAFEIVMARKMARGELQTTWFERHGSQPITELPKHWPDDYKRLVERRIEVIESNPQIALIEQPEYKRRWNTEPWDSQVQRALRSWLLDRLESYFDFDGRMNDDGTPTSCLDIGITSVARLADVARQDTQFLEVGEVYRDDPAFDVQHLVEELVAAEHVPLLPILRYKPAGLRKRTEWKKTWDLQRAEDAIDTRTQLAVDDPAHLTTNLATDLKRREIGEIPVPPKYKSSDFISTGGARYWHLRGKLDVPKERWISFPHCEGSDGTLMIAWAGYDHLQQARAISAHYIDIRDNIGGSDDPRLVPLLVCLIELLPWLHQWHSEIDPEFDLRMDEYYENFVATEASGLRLSRDDIVAWTPPERVGKKKATKKSTKDKVIAE